MGEVVRESKRKDVMGNIVVQEYVYDEHGNFLRHGKKTILTQEDIRKEKERAEEKRLKEEKKKKERIAKEKAQKEEARLKAIREEQERIEREEEEEEERLYEQRQREAANRRRLQQQEMDMRLAEDKETFRKAYAEGVVSYLKGTFDEEGAITKERMNLVVEMINWDDIKYCVNWYWDRPTFEEVVEELFGDTKKIHRMASNLAIKERLDELKQQKDVEPEKPKEESVKILDTDLIITQTSREENLAFLQRVVDVSLDVITERIASGSLKKKREELYQRGLRCFEYYFVDGLTEDEAAQKVIDEFDAKVGHDAIRNNMNKVFIKEVLGYAVERAMVGYLIPDDAEFITGIGEPDYIYKDKDDNIVYVGEIKARKKDGKEKSVKWLIQNECKYFPAYMEQGIPLRFIYVKYNKQVCIVEDYDVVASTI